MKALQRRASRQARGGALVDMNLVSLIDVFTILIFFLLANSVEVELLPVQRSVRLPESTSQQPPRDTPTPPPPEGRPGAQVREELQPLPPCLLYTSPSPRD